MNYNVRKIYRFSLAGPVNTMKFWYKLNKNTNSVFIEMKDRHLYISTEVKPKIRVYHG